MNNMKANPPLVGRTHLAKIVADELAFYRQLFHLADQQRDRLQADTDVETCDTYNEIHRVQGRIEQSERALQDIRQAAPGDFEQWMRMPQVAANMRNIVELVERTQEVIADCVRLAAEKRARYRAELGRMGTGRLLLASMGSHSGIPRFLDHRE